MTRCQRARYQHVTNVCIINSNDMLTDNSLTGVVKKKKTLTMYMGQNVPYPSLSTEQAGKTYYISRLIANILGIVNNSNDHLTTYVWKEGDANRRMNNAVSCLHLYLKKHHIFDHVCSDLVIVGLRKIIKYDLRHKKFIYQISCGTRLYNTSREK